MAKSNLDNSKNVTKISSREYILNDVEFIEEKGSQETPKGLKVLKVGMEIELLPGGADIAVTKDNL